MSDERFQFSTAVNLSEQQFVALNRLTSRTSWRLYMSGTVIVASLMLLDTFTFLLGVGLFIIPALAIFAPHKLPVSQEAEYRKSPYFRQLPVLGVSDEGMLFRTEQVDAEIVWRKPFVWEIHDGWLRISPPGFPACWFPVSDLKQAGVFDQVMKKCRKFGVEYDSDEARRTDYGKSLRTIYAKLWPGFSRQCRRHFDRENVGG